MCRSYCGCVDDRSAVETLYRGLFQDAMYDESEEMFGYIQKQMLDMLTEKNPSRFVLSDVCLSGNIATAEFYVRDGYTVETNGFDLQRDGARHTVCLEITDKPVFLDVTVTGRGGAAHTYRRFVANRRQLFPRLIPEDTANVFAARDDTVVNGLTYRGALNTRGVMITMRPTDVWSRFTLDVGRLIDGVPVPRKLSCRITNPCGHSLTLYAYLENGACRKLAAPTAYRSLVADMGGAAERLVFEIRSTYASDQGKEMRIIVEDFSAEY